LSEDLGERRRWRSAHAEVLLDSRAEGIRVTVELGNDDHGQFEAETVGADVELIRGGSGDDRLTGDVSEEPIAGWLGNDLIEGGPGGVDLIGGLGNDTVTAVRATIDWTKGGGEAVGTARTRRTVGPERTWWTAPPVSSTSR
jgi:Ca2+-binding RTX toxin-like protein